MRVVASVLHYRSWPEVRETIDALLAQSRPADAVVVVDNGSGDGSAEKLGQAYPQVEVVAVEGNRGPIGGMNIALSSGLERDAEAILLVTDDCRLAPDALELLAARLEAEPLVGAAGPLLASASVPERVNSAGGTIDRRTWDTHSLDQPREVSAWTGRAPFTVDWHNSSALLLRAEAARAAGSYHEELRYFYDEPDYLLRLPPLGWRVECVPAAVAWHEVGEPAPDARARSRMIFLSRRAPRRIMLREFVRIPYLALRALLPSSGTPDERRAARQRVRGMVQFLRERAGR